MIARLAPLAALALAGCAAAPRPAPAPAPSPLLAGVQYLYGSGEAAAASRATWRALVDHVRRQIAARPRDGVVLAPGATLDRPAWLPCGARPFAAVFDVDETVLLNRGFEYDAVAGGAAFDRARWQAFERTGGGTAIAAPGAADALARLRAMGVTVVFNTNRTAANADATAATIARAGLGPAEHGRTLFLAGDDAGGDGKDGRRATIAARYCVVAMGGDQLGDFSDLFNAGLAPAARRAAADGPLATLWGTGWFMLPNPVYGPALKGGVDALFPPEARWAPGR